MLMGVLDIGWNHDLNTRAIIKFRLKRMLFFTPLFAKEAEPLFPPLLQVMKISSSLVF